MLVQKRNTKPNVWACVESYGSCLNVMTMLKHHSNRGDVIYRQGKSISVSSGTGRISTEIDGDPGPALPVEIKVIPQAVNCIVPEGAKPAGIRTRIIRAIG